jgi:hypothetical protein
MSEGRLQKLVESLPSSRELRQAQADHLAAAAILRPLISAAEAKERAGQSGRGKRTLALRAGTSV